MYRGSLGIEKVGHRGVFERIAKPEVERILLSILMKGDMDVEGWAPADKLIAGERGAVPESVFTTTTTISIIYLNLEESTDLLVSVIRNVDCETSFISFYSDNSLSHYRPLH